MELIYWSVRSSSRSGGDGVKGVEGGNRYFIPLRVSLFREQENLAKDPSNNIFIAILLFKLNTNK